MGTITRFKGAYRAFRSDQRLVNTGVSKTVFYGIYTLWILLSVVGAKIVLSRYAFPLARASEALRFAATPGII